MSLYQKITWGLSALVLISLVFWLGFKTGTETTLGDSGIPSEISEDPLTLVPEGWRRLDDYTIVIDIGVLPGELRSIFVEYGLEAGALNESTLPTSQELGMGTKGEYGSYSVTIPHSDLEPGMSYFYRIVGETEGGEIIRTGLNRFTAGK